jgi:hypothetical protein
MQLIKLGPSYTGKNMARPVIEHSMVLQAFLMKNRGMNKRDAGKVDFTDTNQPNCRSR